MPTMTSSKYFQPHQNKHLSAQIQQITNLRLHLSSSSCSLLLSRIFNSISLAPYHSHPNNNNETICYDSRAPRSRSSGDPTMPSNPVILYPAASIIKQQQNIYTEQRKLRECYRMKKKQSNHRSIPSRSSFFFRFLAIAVPVSRP